MSVSMEDKKKKTATGIDDWKKVTQFNKQLKMFYASDSGRKIFNLVGEPPANLMAEEDNPTAGQGSIKSGSAGKAGSAGAGGSQGQDPNNPDGSQQNAPPQFNRRSANHDFMRNLAEEMLWSFMLYKQVEPDDEYAVVLAVLHEAYVMTAILKLKMKRHQVPCADVEALLHDPTLEMPDTAMYRVKASKAGQYSEALRNMLRHYFHNLRFCYLVKKHRETAQCDRLHKPTYENAPQLRPVSFLCHIMARLDKIDASTAPDDNYSEAFEKAMREAKCVCELWDLNAETYQMTRLLSYSFFATDPDLYKPRLRTIAAAALSLSCKLLERINENVNAMEGRIVMMYVGRHIVEQIQHFEQQILQVHNYNLLPDVMKEATERYNEDADRPRVTEIHRIDVDHMRLLSGEQRAVMRQEMLKNALGGDIRIEDSTVDFTYLRYMAWRWCAADGEQPPEQEEGQGEQEYAE